MRSGWGLEGHFARNRDRARRRCARHSVGVWQACRARRALLRDYYFGLLDSGKIRRSLEKRLAAILKSTEAHFGLVEEHAWGRIPASHGLDSGWDRGAVGVLRRLAAYLDRTRRPGCFAKSAALSHRLHADLIVLIDVVRLSVYLARNARADAGAAAGRRDQVPVARRDRGPATGATAPIRSRPGAAGNIGRTKPVVSTCGPGPTAGTRTRQKAGVGCRR
jgi:hypothetical protein